MGRVIQVFEICFAKDGGKKTTGSPRSRRENIKADLHDLQTRSVTVWI